MLPINLNLIMAFLLALMGVRVYRSHMMSTLLCLEGMMLSLFILMTLLITHFHMFSICMIPLILLVFSTFTTSIYCNVKNPSINLYVNSLNLVLQVNLTMN